MCLQADKLFYAKLIHVHVAFFSICALNLYTCFQSIFTTLHAVMSRADGTDSKPVPSLIAGMVPTGKSCDCLREGSGGWRVIGNDQPQLASRKLQQRTMFIPCE